MAPRTLILTASAMVAFAANSVLCRLALGHGAIDANSFALIRLASGAAILVFLVSLRQGFDPRRRGGSWASAVALFLYAVPFALSYRQLEAGTGALLLFGAVQLTMVAVALARGERPAATQWLGWLAAIGGLVWLLAPGAQAPAALGAALMLLAGMAWGIYSLRGSGRADPLSSTADNFVRATPFALLVSLVAFFTGRGPQMSMTGATLAVVSGAITSGLGYVAWYAALRGLRASQAATVQLSVPVLAALGGAALLAESPGPRLIVASLLILGGVGLSLRR